MLQTMKNNNNEIIETTKKIIVIADKQQGGNNGFRALMLPMINRLNDNNSMLDEMMRVLGIGKK